MVFSFDDQTKSTVACIPGAQLQERYHCRLSTCPSPACGCWVIYLDLFPADGAVSDPLQPAGLVAIDLWEEKLGFTEKNRPTSEGLRFAERFLQNLTEEDYAFLRARHFEIKNRQAEEARPETIDAHFDFREVEREGLLQSYHDILPFGNRLYVTLDDRKLAVLDQYCIRPDCSCADANISVVDVDEVTQKGGEMACVNVNYKKRAWQLVAGGPLPLTVDALRSAIEETIPDFYETLRKRHDKLKAIYAFNKKKLSVVAQPALPKTGRNDPCPCGSGRKYKKCCIDK